MGENTNIQWAHHTFNPWRGCTKVALGCANCYADQQSERNPKTLGIWGQNGTRVVAAESMWREPVKWNRCAVLTCTDCRNDYMTEPAPKGVVPIENSWDFECVCGCNSYTAARPRVFCASLADVFEDWQGLIKDSAGHPLHHAYAWKMPGVWTGVANTFVGKSIVKLEDVRARLFRLIDATPHLDWLLLTKRPENIRRMIPRKQDRPDVIVDGMTNLAAWHRENVWLGTSIACQEDAERNVSELLKCRGLAANLFVSLEPMVGRVDITPWIGGRLYRCTCGYHGTESELAFSGGDRYLCVQCGTRCVIEQSVDWVIVGGESGPNARPCDVDWIRAIVGQCRDAGVPVFVKQLGARAMMRRDSADGRKRGDNPEREWPSGTRFSTPKELAGTDWHGHWAMLRDKKGGDPAEWPEDVRVREVPS